MARPQIQEMMGWLGTNMRLLNLLIDEIKRQGGDPEILVHLTRDRFLYNLEDIVKTALACDWRIPASEIRSRALRHHNRNFRDGVDPDIADEVANLWWTPVLLDLGIPFQRYCSDRNEGPPALPLALLGKLNGKKMEYPLLIDDKVVVDWKTSGDRIVRPSHTISAMNITHIALADQKHFDFDK